MISYLQRPFNCSFRRSLENEAKIFFNVCSTACVALDWLGFSFGAKYLWLFVYRKEGRRVVMSNASQPWVSSWLVSWRSLLAVAIDSVENFLGHRCTVLYKSAWSWEEDFFHCINYSRMAKVFQSFDSEPIFPGVEHLSISREDRPNQFFAELSFSRSAVKIAY